MYTAQSYVLQSLAQGRTGVEGRFTFGLRDDVLTVKNCYVWCFIEDGVC